MDAAETTQPSIPKKRWVQKLEGTRFGGADPCEAPIYSLFTADQTPSLCTGASFAPQSPTSRSNQPPVFKESGREYWDRGPRPPHFHRLQKDRCQNFSEVTTRPSDTKDDKATTLHNNSSAPTTTFSSHQQPLLQPRQALPGRGGGLSKGGGSAPPRFSEAPE